MAATLFWARIPVCATWARRLGARRLAQRDLGIWDSGLGIGDQRMSDSAPRRGPRHQQVLRGRARASAASRSTCAPARSTRSSARTAPASRRSSRSSPAPKRADAGTLVIAGSAVPHNDPHTAHASSASPPSTSSRPLSAPDRGREHRARARSAGGSWRRGSLEGAAPSGRGVAARVGAPIASGPRASDH